MADQKTLAQALMKFVSPGSTVSNVGNQDAYQRHIMESQAQGQQPMTYEQFQAALKQGS